MPKGVETLYHGSTVEIAGPVIDGQDLYGIDETDLPGLSGTLTKRLNTAIDWAHETQTDKPGRRIVLIFHIPQHYLINNLKLNKEMH